MEIGQAWEAWGLWGLFLASFIAATLLPLSSEALLGALVLHGWPGLPLLAVATAGNTLGGLVNYGIGRWVPEGRLARWTRIDPAITERWRALAHRHGAWAALLCWLPIIGDPIALALGLFRVPLLPTAVLMAVGKAVRYAVVTGALGGTFG